MTTGLISQCVLLAGILTQTSSYTFVSPKIFSQSLQPSSRTWSNIVPYPLRAYQPSIPLQYMRYYGDPYYANDLQNADYYFPQDSYDDGDYYSNFLYYLPTRRRNSYYEPTVLDSVDDLPDYDDDLSDDQNGILKSQRDWWLENDVAPNEDVDIQQLNRISNPYGPKNAVSKTETKITSKNARKNVRKSRFGGIDGFGRRKEGEQVNQNQRMSARQGERLPVYGRPIHFERNEDTDVQDLKSLREKPLNTDDEVRTGDVILNNWYEGVQKRKSKQVPKFKTEEKFAKEDKFIKPKTSEFSMNDQGGRDLDTQNDISVIGSTDSIPKRTELFDRIKILLALEDRANEIRQDPKTHRMLKRKPPAYKPSTQMKNKPSNKDRSRAQSSSTVTSSGAKGGETMTPSGAKGGELMTTASPGNRAVKRSVPSAVEENNDSISYQNKDDSLVRQLSAVKYQGS